MYYLISIINYRTIMEIINAPDWDPNDTRFMIDIGAFSDGAGDFSFGEKIIRLLNFVKKELGY